MKRVLQFLSLTGLFLAPLSVVACGFNVIHGDNKPDGGIDPDEDIDQNKAADYLEQFEKYDEHLESFAKGADFKSYQNYFSKEYLRLSKRDSSYVPTEVFVHKNDEIKVFLDKTKTTTDDIDFIKNNPSVFAIGMDGHWGNTLEPFLNENYTSPGSTYFESAQKKGLVSVDVVSEGNDYVVSFNAPRFGILYKHIASELFITKILVNNDENEISRKNFVYKATKDDAAYPLFWEEVYQAYDQFIETGASVENQLTTKTPMAIFYGERFNFIIDTIKLFIIIYTAEQKGIDYRSSNLNNFLTALDFIGRNVLEYQGVSTRGAGVFNKIFSFQKQNVVLSDGGAGLFYNSSQYFAMHSNWTGGAVNFTSFVASNKDFYKEQQFRSTFTGKDGEGYLFTTAESEKDVKNFLRQSNWGFLHELGHNYQMYNYKLSTWGEVTVNISIVGVNKKAWEMGYFSGEEFYDYIRGRSGFTSIVNSLAKNSVRQNALYEGTIESGKKNYHATDTSKKYVLTDMELIFWVQLCLGLGDSFIAELNNYYRTNHSAINSKISELTTYYDSVKGEYNSNFNPESHAKLDVLIDSITKITNTNLKTFFTKWGLEIPESTSHLMDSLGADHGDSLYKIIFDKEYTGLDNQDIWTNNINGGFLVPNISEKMSSFSSWGTLDVEELVTIPTNLSLPSIVADQTQMRFTDRLVNSAKHTIGYQIENSFGENPRRQAFLNNYWKIRGDNQSSSFANQNYYHIYQNTDEKRIYFFKNSNTVINIDPMGEEDFAIVYTKSASGEVFRTTSLRNNGQISPQSFSWPYIENSVFEIKFLSTNFVLQDPEMGSQVWNKETNTFTNFSNFVNNENVYRYVL